MHHQIVIVGGGTAGITVASRLLRSRSDLDIAVVEPSEKHYYQLLWTLVGGDIFPKEASERAGAEVMPEQVTWIKDAVTPFHHAVQPQPGGVTARSTAGDFRKCKHRGPGDALLTT